jgi:TM2 domain-containing membrane protein YozV
VGTQHPPRRRLIAISPDDGTAIDLRNPFLAAALSWLVPGLGQIYQGRRFKGGLCMAALLGCLVCGLWLGGGRVVYAAWRPGEPRLAFIGQSGIGAVAIPAVLQSLRLHGPAHEPHFASALFAPPLRPGQLVSPAYAARLARTEPDVGADDFFDRPPLKQFRRDQLSMWQRRLGRRFEIGTLYTVIAGMLNVLVALDAFVGPLRTASRDDTAARAAPPPASENKV